MNIIKALSFYMEQQGWTKAELNRQSGVNLATISLVMNGHRGASLTTMKMWSDSFGIPLSEFIKAGEQYGEEGLLRNDTCQRQV